VPNIQGQRGRWTQKWKRRSGRRPLRKRRASSAWALPDDTTDLTALMAEEEAHAEADEEEEDFDDGIPEDDE
jgi:hypothetical protein